MFDFLPQSRLCLSQAGVYSSGGPTPPASPPGYGQVYNTGAQTINNGNTITFDSNGPLLNISHVAGSDTITINATGTYMVTWVVSAQGDGGAYTLLQNGVAVPTLSFVTDPGNGESVGNGIVNASSGDTIQLRNNTGLILALQTQAGFVNASITFEKMISSGASSGTNTLVGNVGSATQAGGIINVVTSDTTALFTGAGNTLTLDFALSNLGIGSSYPSLTVGVQNTSVGDLALHSISSGISNTAMGYNALALLSTGQSNVAIGEGAGSGLTTQNHNTAVGTNALEVAGCADATAIGSNALVSLISGNQNTAIGSGALSALATGDNNIACGFDAGINYTTNESSNLIINHAGVALENNTIRIGTTGGGAGQQNRCFIAGIDGVNVGSVLRVVTEASDQLGTAVLTAGANITLTAGANTITIAANTGSETVNYTSVNHAASPYTVLAADYYIGADVSAGVITIRLPDAPATGRVFVVKDKAGLSATSNITVTTVSGADLIDGFTTFTLNNNYQAASFIWNGSAYEIW